MSTSLLHLNPGVLYNECCICSYLATHSSAVDIEKLSIMVR